MFGYLRGKRATEPVEKLPFPPAVTDAKPAEPEGYRQVPGHQGAALAEPDSAAGPADDVGNHPTFSEWRTAISIMPWLQETGIGPSEADEKNPDVVSEESDMLGLPPRRDRGTVRLPWASWPRGQSAGARTVDLARRSRPARKERIAADFPNDIIEAAWRRQGGRCAGCGRWLIWPHRDRNSGTGAWESHHRVPVDEGGGHLLSDCVLFCSGLADCHFNRGHEGIGWTHYAPIDESALVFLFAGSATVTAPTAPVRPKRSLLREVFGIPQPARGRGKPRDESGGRDSTG